MDLNTRYRNRRAWLALAYLAVVLALDMVGVWQGVSVVAAAEAVLTWPGAGIAAVGILMLVGLTHAGFDVSGAEQQGYVPSSMVLGAFVQVALVWAVVAALAECRRTRLGRTW